MMFFDGYIGAPPTSTVISAKEEESAAPPSVARLIAAANAAPRTVNMQFLLQTWCRRAAGSDPSQSRYRQLRARAAKTWRCRLVPLATSTIPAQDSEFDSA